MSVASICLNFAFKGNPNDLNTFMLGCLTISKMLASDVVFSMASIPSIVLGKYMLIGNLLSNESWNRSEGLTFSDINLLTN